MGAVETKTKLIDIVEFQQMRRTMSMIQCAKFYGVTVSALYKWGNRHNVILKRITDDEIAEGIMVMTPKELAAEYNVSLYLIYGHLKKMGISTKQKGQR